MTAQFVYMQTLHKNHVTAVAWIGHTLQCLTLIIDNLRLLQSTRILKNKNALGLCYSWVYQPALCKVSSNSIQPFFLWKANKNTSINISDRQILRLKVCFSYLGVHETWRYVKISQIKDCCIYIDSRYYSLPYHL